MMEIIIATGLIAVILLVIGFKLDNKHQVLKVFSLFFAVFIVLMLGKFASDSKEVCKLELQNTTMVGNNTFYNYETLCYNVTKSNTPNTVYISSLWYFRVVFVYVFGFIIWLVGTYLMAVTKKNE